MNQKMMIIAGLGLIAAAAYVALLCGTHPGPFAAVVTAEIGIGLLLEGVQGDR